ncbi:hypothetical protein B0H21DRAFT_141474 [Amylocystis lapponica]|nr:hypothetical protein B0H21DRAFT_141474 [Amylocystis lapponica]
MDETGQWCADCDNLSAYLRIASLAVAGYDWLCTIPVEFEIYGEQVSFFHMGRACVLFALIRYFSIVTLLSNNIGFFATNMPAAACARFIFFAPVMKCAQMAVAHIILFVRTWAISGRVKWVFWILLLLLVSCVTLELWSSIYKRIPTQSPSGNCASGNAPGYKVSFVFYVAAMVFDTACLVIATMYLWMQSFTRGGMHGLARVLFNEGLLYFVVLHAANMLNLIVWLRAWTVQEQSAASSLGYSLTWIMAQRILIQLHQLRGATSGSLSGLGEVSNRHTLQQLTFQTGSHTLRRKASAEASGIELSGVHLSAHVSEPREPAGGLNPDVEQDKKDSQESGGLTEVQRVRVELRG